MGSLVSGEMANAYLFDEEAVARMTREWIEVLNRDFQSSVDCDLGSRQ
jgi:hypothetical protein